MTDLSMVDTERVREALSELQGQSDVHVPVLASSVVTGGAGALMIHQGEQRGSQQLVEAGFGLTGIGAGLSVAEAASMTHHMMIEDRGGRRQFKFHHDAAGALGILLGAVGLEIDDVPNEFALFLTGLGAGTILHHVITELTLEFYEES